jgi:hypothetical protein
MASIRGTSSPGANESGAGDDRSGSGHDESAAETTNRAWEATDRAPSWGIGAGAYIPVPEASERIPPQASRPQTRAAGRLSRDADRRSGRTTRGVNDSSGEGSGPWPEQADGPPSRRLPRASGRTRRGGSGSRAEGAIPGREETSTGRSKQLLGRSNQILDRSNQILDRSNQILGRATGFSTEQPDSRPSNQILGRATGSTAERRLAACARSNPYQLTVLKFPTVIRSFRSIIALQSRTALAYVPLPIGPPHTRILIEHTGVTARSSRARCSRGFPASAGGRPASASGARGRVGTIAVRRRVGPV